MGRAGSTDPGRRGAAVPRRGQYPGRERASTSWKTACCGYRGPEGVVVADIAEGTSAAGVGLARGDVLLAIDDRPVQAVSDVIEALHAAEAGATARYTVLRLGAPRGRRSANCPHSERRAAVLLPARLDRSFHVARGGRGPAAPAARPGDGPFLLALGGVLRPLHVLVQRPPGSPRLDLLLGRRPVHPAASGAVSAFYARVPGAQPAVGG